MIKVLDYGYVELIETWGCEEEIIEAARMSTNKGFVEWGKDIKLLTYLYKNKHMTPFEMAGIIIEVKAPIFVFREWHRHRTQSYNEMSARYIPLPNEAYVPTVERLLIRSTNKQANSTGNELTDEGAEIFIDTMESFYAQCEVMYQSFLNSGVSKELARLCLPVGRYSKMRASANLRNWLQFLELRMAENAQWEIRQYANAVYELIKQNFPRTAGLFNEGRNK